VEDHPAHRHRRLEDLQEVPRDGLALAVLVGGEEQLVRALEGTLELGNLLLLVGVHHVVGLEVGVDVDGESAEAALLLRDRQVRGGREVTDVPDAGLDLVACAEVALDRLRLGLRLDDHQPADRGRGLVRVGHAAPFLAVSRSARAVGVSGPICQDLSNAGLARPRPRRAEMITGP